MVTKLDQHYKAMAVKIRALADAEIANGGKAFMDWPDRWFREGPLYRCQNDHVSSTVLKSEAQGRDVCLACFKPIHLTFPEDKDGPMEDTP